MFMNMDARTMGEDELTMVRGSGYKCGGDN